MNEERIVEVCTFKPRLVTVLAVGACADDGTVAFLELVLQARELADFCRADKGKVARIEKEYDPLPPIIRQTNLRERSIVVRGNLRKLRRLFSYFNHCCVGCWCTYPV